MWVATRRRRHNFWIELTAGDTAAFGGFEFRGSRFSAAPFLGPGALEVQCVAKV